MGDVIKLTSCANTGIRLSTTEPAPPDRILSSHLQEGFSMSRTRRVIQIAGPALSLPWSGPARTWAAAWGRQPSPVLAARLPAHAPAHKVLGRSSANIAITRAAGSILIRTGASVFITAMAGGASAPGYHGVFAFASANISPWKGSPYGGTLARLPATPPQVSTRRGCAKRATSTPVRAAGSITGRITPCLPGTCLEMVYA